MFLLNPQAEIKTSLNLSTIFEYLKPTQNPTVRHAAMLFIHEILEAKWDPPLCRLTNPPDEITLRLLFSLLLGVAFIDKSDASYECLKAFLVYCEANDNLFKHFLRAASLLHFIIVNLRIIFKIFNCLKEFSTVVIKIGNCRGFRQFLVNSSDPDFAEFS